jgi:hypothetical protein
MAEAIFKGASGRLHRFSAAAPNAAFPSAPAVYAFARPGPGGRGWTPLFVSRTANLAKRMANHEIWQEALRLGTTHVLIHQRGARDAREAVEADLLASLRPVLNGAMDAPRSAVALGGAEKKVLSFRSFSFAPRRTATA